MNELERFACLITGANGFLGSEVVRKTLEAGVPVCATDRLDTTQFSDLEYRQADILRPKSLESVFKDVHTVIHTAGLAHVFGQLQANAAPFRAVNEEGTANVACAASKAGVHHFILISSVSVYGDGRSTPDEYTVCRPRGPYAESKLGAEERAVEVAQSGNMRLTILRLATLYGEGDPGNVARLMRAIDRNRFLRIGKGSNQKSLLYRGDAARACLTVLQSEGSGVDIYNVSAPPVTMADVIDGLASALNRRVPRWYIPASLALGIVSAAAKLSGDRGPAGTLKLTLQKWLADDVYDASKFGEKFGFETQVELTEGLRREVEWYRRHD